MPETCSQRRFFAAWGKILIQNLILQLLCHLQGVTVAGHWLDVKRKGTTGVLSEAGDEFWREEDKPSRNVGPFEPPDEDFSKWVKYVDKKNEALKMRIRELEDHILQAGLSNNGPSTDKSRKIPEGNGKRGEDGTSETPLMRIIEDNLPEMRRHLEVLRNLSAYLEDVKSGSHGDVETIQEMIAEAERRKSGASDTRRASDFLAERLRTGSPAPRAPEGGCAGATGDERMREVLRQVQGRLSETFLYRNITLAAVSEMSRIVDFVERYRGNVGDLSLGSWPGAGGPPPPEN